MEMCVSLLACTSFSIVNKWDIKKEERKGAQKQGRMERQERKRGRKGGERNKEKTKV